jgi:hypothetical protein
MIKRILFGLLSVVLLSTMAFARGTSVGFRGVGAASSGDLRAPADARGLRFMPAVTVDPQNDLGEPSLRIDQKGNIYSCGPQGTSAAADRAQMSLDGGDTFRLLGEPPGGRIGPGGGGDCEIEVAPEKNSAGNYNLYYAGLEALLNFSASQSTDEGKTFIGTNTSGAAPTVDRQWMAAAGSSTNYLFYNENPGGGTVQRSDDGGMTYQLASAPGNAAPNISRPGNIVVDPNHARNPDDKNNETLYGIYTNNNQVELFRSTDRGQTFKQFKIADAAGDPNSLFATLSIDTAGNLYAAWVEKGSYDVFYSYSTDHGQTWAPKQTVNRKGAPSNLMPWIAAGDPGRIAIAFYCSPVDGNPETAEFHSPWYVCVDQSLNALSPNASFSQVRANSHPNHWDQVCTGGIGCTTGGDRTLYDFFTLRADPRDGRLYVVFTQSNKIPGTAAGVISIDTLTKQKSGPSLFASPGRVVPDRRRNVRRSASDPKGDALFDFSSFGPPDPKRQNQPALDLRRLKLSRSSLKVNGKKQPALKLRMKTSSLSDPDLTSALQNMESQQLMFVVRWFSGFQPDYVVASWRPAQGFSFSYGHLDTSTGPLLETYAGDQTTPGKVNAKKATITLKIPYRQIQRFKLGADKSVTPKEHPARRGTHIWEVTAFTFGRVNPGGGASDYFNQADSTPSFDFRLP